MSSKCVVAFDVYGTLLSTESIAKQLATHCGQEQASSIAANWRKYQLEYTWRLNSMNTYIDFEQVTRRSLLHALAEAKIELSDAHIQQLLEAYDTLGTFDDVIPTLKTLQDKPHLRAVVFSNGTHKMISSSVHESPDLKSLAAVFHDIVVVEEVQRYKPAPETYHHLARKVGKDPSKESEMQDIWLVSGNPFDIVGAKQCGLQAIWVDRGGNGWQDALLSDAAYQPTAIVTSLEQVVSIIEP